jgi:2-(1,2-epoxy-1,2-dihydrophenyl)acetyl-CoA isomerase
MSIAYETIQYEVRGAVAAITLNRPEVLNALNAALRRELIDAIGAAAGDERIRAVILGGNGRAFCTGADLAEKRPADFSPQIELEDEIKPALLAIANAPKPFIAAVNGIVAGGGVGYALACDLVLMSEQATMLQPFVSIGLIPDAGATWHLLQQLGRKRAYELMTSGERVPAARCLELGLVNRVVPAAALMDEAWAWAAALAAKAPLSLRYAKQALAAVEHMTLEQAIGYESALQNRLMRSRDAKEGVRAFLEKRAPAFEGR